MESVKCGVPPVMLRMIRSFHEGMKAEVRVGNLLSDCFEVQNDLCDLYATSRGAGRGDPVLQIGNYQLHCFCVRAEDISEGRVI